MRFVGRRLIVALLFAAAAGFLLYFFYTNWESVVAAWRSVSWTALLVSTVLGIAGFALFPVALCQLYRGLDTGGCSTPRVWSVYFIANIMKYIPGKVANVAMIIDGAGRQSLSRIKMLQSVLAALGLSIWVSLLLALAVFVPGLDDSTWGIAALVLLGLGAGLVVHPGANFRLMQLMLKILRRPHQDVGRFDGSRLLRAFLVTLAAWVLIGAGFAVLALDHQEPDPRLFILCALAYPAAFSAGVVAIFVPAGFGVREGLLITFLIQVVQGPFSRPDGMAVALLLVLAHRVVMTLVDLWLLLLALVVKKLAL